MPIYIVFGGIKLPFWANISTGSPGSMIAVRIDSNLRQFMRIYEMAGKKSDSPRRNRRTSSELFTSFKVQGRSRLKETHLLHRSGNLN